MKIKMIKHQMERWCQDYEQELLENAGWKKADNEPAKSEKIVKVAEPLVLKPPVKSKGTAKETLDNANQQGDE